MKTTIIQNNDIDTPARQIAGYIKKQLASNKSVLWMVSGGSVIKVAVRVRQLLGALKTDTVLHVALCDERYGEVGHLNSNLEKLLLAGFDSTGLIIHPVLRGGAIASTSKNYNNTLHKVLGDVDSMIGILGMGADGHTAGLLPGNPLMDRPDYVGYFTGPDFERITTTPALLRQIDQVCLYAVGEEKWPIISKIDTTTLPVACLRQAKYVTVYTDYKGAKL